MCLKWFFSIFYNDYEDFPLVQSDDPFLKGIDILMKEEPNLVLAYSEEGGVRFSNEWRKWYTRLHPKAYEFFKNYQPLDVQSKLGPDFNISQFVFLTRIPKEKHEEFYQSILNEYK